MLNDPTRPDTLDDFALPERGEVKAGWRLWVLVGLLVLVFLKTLPYLIRIGQLQSIYQYFIPDVFLLEYGVSIFIAIGTASSAVLLALRRQAGWVIALFFSSWAVVATAFITLAVVLPRMPSPPTLPSTGFGFEVVRTTPEGRAYIAGALFLLSCFLLYLVTSKQVRRAFRIPRSWVGRALTFGGLVGAVMGAWFYMMLR